MARHELASCGVGAVLSFDPMLVAVALVALSLVPLAWTSYLGALAFLSGRNTEPPLTGPMRTRFDVIVPAHNEELGIAATIASLLAVDYPAELRRVVVVADNCQDATAARAREAGAIVLERTDTSKRGKGYALERAFEQSLREGLADAVVVVDADTTVTANLLRAFAVRLSRGAVAAQAEYGVANRTASWRTRLMHIALTLFHCVRSRARERLGVSAGLRGNGMAFACSLLRDVPHDAFSIVEDIEYGIRLGLAGHRVEYAGEAQVFGQMVSTESASRSQRRRWEGGGWPSPGSMCRSSSRPGSDDTACSSWTWRPISSFHRSRTWCSSWASVSWRPRRGGGGEGADRGGSWRPGERRWRGFWRISFVACGWRASAARGARPLVGSGLHVLEDRARPARVAFQNPEWVRTTREGEKP